MRRNVLKVKNIIMHYGELIKVVFKMLKEDRDYIMKEKVKKAA
jgi:hypothetical protein